MELSKSKIEYFTFDKFQIVGKIGLLCSGSASQTRESIRHPVGKGGGEGGVGGNRWQVANANGNSLTIWDLL